MLQVKRFRNLSSRCLSGAFDVAMSRSGGDKNWTGRETIWPAYEYGTMNFRKEHDLRMSIKQ